MVSPVAGGAAAANGEAEKEGFEPSRQGFSPPNALAGRRLQPLGHFSGRATGYRTPSSISLQITLQGHGGKALPSHADYAGSPRITPSRHSRRPSVFNIGGLRCFWGSMPPSR